MLFGEQTVFAKSQGTSPIQKGTWIAVFSKTVTVVEETTVMVNGKEEVKKQTRKTPKSFVASFKADGRLDAKNQADAEAKATGCVVESVYKV